MTRIIRDKAVVAGVVQPAKRQRRAHLAALGGVVVYDVEDHLDAGGMQPSHRDAHLVRGILGQIARLDREEAERVIAPVVAQPLLEERAVLHEGVDRQQLDRRDAEPAQMVDDFGISERRECAALVRLDVLAELCEPAQMRLVDHGIGPRDVRRPVVSPVEALVGHDAFHHPGCAVAAIKREIRARRVHTMAEQRVRPFQLAGDTARVGIEQQLVRIEAIAALWLIRAVGAEAIEQPDLRVRQVTVPHLVGEFGQRISCDLPLALWIEQAEIDALRVRGEDREVRAEPVPGGAERIGRARLQPVRVTCHRFSPRAATSRSPMAEG